MINYSSKHTRLQIAETNCTDRTLRKVLGRDVLPNAALSLEGGHRSSENRLKDKLRIITKDKEINVIEARYINDLGYTGPNSPQFLKCVKKELNVGKENKSHFDLNGKGSIPRILLGLKNGSLLAKQLSEKQMIELKVKQPFLSPNLLVWSTPINSKLLITGSLGVDPHLVEPVSNYPRYSFLVKEDLSEADIEDKINKEAKELEAILEVEFKRDKDLNEKCFSFTENKEENVNHFPHFTKLN